MSEENSLVYCSLCGSSNPSTFKFCSNCGAKLDQADALNSEPEPVKDSFFDQPKDSFFDQNTSSAYERAEAEIVSDGKVPITQDELNINYAASEEEYSAESFAPKTQYYSDSTYNNTNVTPDTNGNGGFAIASMVCGIISIVCCCLTWFSLILGIVAVVLGIIAINNKYDGKGMAIAGIITGGIGIFIWLIVLLATGSSMFASFVEELSGI